MRILVLKPSALGDVVQALPIARLIRRHYPNAEIHWWIDARLAPLLDGDPDINSLVIFQRDRWSVPWRWNEALQSAIQLRASRFDVALDLQALARSALVAWLCNADLTIGLDDPREGAPTFYDVRVPRPCSRLHAIDWYLDALRFLGVPVRWDFDWLPFRPVVAGEIAALIPPDGTQWIALQPGARWPNKRWPPEYFAQLIRLTVATLPNTRFVILGAPGDRELSRTVSAAAPGKCLDLTGRTSLPQLVECLRRCAMLVGNDSGPMHIAAALGKPVVALFGPTDPARTGPYGQINRVVQADLPCVPCLSKRCRNPRHMACLRDLTPDTVTRAVLKIAGELTGQ